MWLSSLLSWYPSNINTSVRKHRDAKVEFRLAIFFPTRMIWNLWALSRGALLYLEKSNQMHMWLENLTTTLQKSWKSPSADVSLKFYIGRSKNEKGAWGKMCGVWDLSVVCPTVNTWDLRAIKQLSLGLSLQLTKSPVWITMCLTAFS